MTQMDNVIHVNFGARRKRALKPNASELINRANELARSAQYKEALKLYRKACRIEPELWEAHYNLGYCLYEQRRMPGAILSFEKALSLAPHSPHVRFNLASAFNKVGRSI